MATSPTLADQFDKAFDTAVAPPAEPPEDKAAAEPAPEPSEPETPDKPPAEAPESDTAETELLTAEELAEINKDPKLSKSYKLMQGAFTRKTQDLAAQRKSLEPLQQFSEAFQADPKGTLKRVIEHYGIRLDEPAATQAQPQADQMVERVKATFGIEDDSVAQKVAAGMKQIIADSAKELVDPIVKEQKEFRESQVQRETEAILEQFQKKHPDFKKHEAQMAKFMEQVQIQPGKMTEMDFLEACWKIVTYDAKDADRTKEVVQKINNAAKKADTSAPGVSSTRVTKAAPKFESFDQAMDKAFEDAVQGITYESE